MATVNAQQLVNEWRNELAAFSRALNRMRALNHEYVELGEQVYVSGILNASGIPPLESDLVQTFQLYQALDTYLSNAGRWQAIYKTKLG